MKRMIASSVAAVAICAAAFARTIEGDYTVSVDTTLAEDTTVTGALTVESGATLDLNGWTLSAAAVSGSGSIVDSFAEYERLEYLEAEQENAGNLYGARLNAQYIDTGYKHNGTTKVEMRLVFTQTSYPTVSAIQSANYAAYYGARNNNDSTSKQYDFGGWLQNGKIANNGTAGGPGANTTGSPDAVVGRTYDVVLDKASAAKSSMAWDGGSYEFSTGNGGDGTPKQGSTELTDFIFAINQYDGSYWPNFPCRMKCYSCKIYDKKDANGDTVSDYSLKRDFIPVLRKADEEPGMFDLVEGKFYGNAGGGEFTAGATATEGRLQIALSGDGAAIDFSSLTIGSGVVLSFSGEGALSSDLDATAFASVEVASGAVLDLAGHNLTVNAVAGEGAITDTVGTALSGYDRLDFIQSTGKQYVNTGYIHDNTTIVDMRIQFDNVTDQWNAFYGARYNASGSVRGFSMWLNYAKFRRAFGGSAANIDSHTVATSNIYDIHLDKSGAGDCTATPVGGDEIVLGTGTQDNPFDVPDYLFAINQNSGGGWTASYHTEAKLYSCKMYYGTTLARDFVPVKRGDDIGLLDLVEGKFYGSATSTKFEPGTVVATTPGGELRIAVAEGATVEISQTALTGGLKLVKTGEGTLVMSKASQGYAGGTEVQGGVLKSGAESACVFGVEAGEVAIGSAGIVDLNGNAYLATRGWTVAGGGAIFNGGADIAVSLAVSGVFAPVVTTGGFGVTLADGSTIDFTKWTGAFPVALPAVSFAADSTIYVKLTPETEYISELANAVDSETGAKGGYLLEWSVVPSGVAFLRHYASSAGKFRLSVEDGGLRVSRSEGMTLFIR